MKIATLSLPQALVLRPLASRLDAERVEAFKQGLLGAGLELGGAVVLDLDRVEFIDSSGLGAVVWAAKVARRSGGSLQICGARGAVAQVFRLTRMERVLPISGSAPPLVGTRQARA